MSAANEVITDDGECELYVSSDPVVLEAFGDIKTAVLAQRTDIVRQILDAAQILRDEEDFESDSSEHSEIVREKYDAGEYLDLLQLVLNHKDTDSGTLLHYSTRTGFVDITRTLLAAGSRLTIKNRDGKTAFDYCESDEMRNAYVAELMGAVSQSRLSRIRHLLTAGIDVNSSDGGTTGNRVLHWAVSFGNLNAVKLILDSHADLNAVNCDGVTALYDAVKRGDLDVIEELLRRGAAVDIIPFRGRLQGKTVFDLVADKPDIHHMLVRYCRTATDLGAGKDSFGFVSMPGGSEDFKGGFQNSHPEQLLENFANGDFPTLESVDCGLNLLWPVPQVLKQFSGLLFVPPRELPVRLPSSQDAEIIQEMLNLWQLFSSKFSALGICILPEVVVAEVMRPFHGDTCCVQCVIDSDAFAQAEEYRLQITTHKVSIAASCLSAMYYAISTLLQCFQIYRGKAVPLLQISDWGSLVSRRVILDLRGSDFPKLECLCATADVLSLLRVNMICFSVDQISGVPLAESDVFTQREFFEFQTFCQKRFITVTPYVKSSSASQLISGVNDTLKQMEINSNFFSKLLELFMCKRYITLQISGHCSPEFVYFLHEFCREAGYQICLLTDGVGLQLEYLAELVGSSLRVVLSSFDDAFHTSARSLHDVGLPFMVCHDSCEFHRIIPDFLLLPQQVMDVCEFAKSLDVCGMFVKFSRAPSELSCFSLVVPAFCLSCAYMWSAAGKMADPAYAYSCFISSQIYEDCSDTIGRHVVKLGACFRPNLPSTCPATKTPFDNVFVDLQAFTLKDSSQVEIQHAGKVIRAARLGLRAVKPASAFGKMMAEELGSLLSILSVVTRILSGLASLKAKVEQPSIGALPGVLKSDVANKLMSLVAEHERCAEKLYKKRGSSPMICSDVLRRLLECVHPIAANSNVPSSSLRVMNI